MKKLMMVSLLFSVAGLMAEYKAFNAPLKPQTIGVTLTDDATKAQTFTGKIGDTFVVELNSQARTSTYWGKPAFDKLGVLSQVSKATKETMESILPSADMRTGGSVITTYEFKAVGDAANAVKLTIPLIDASKRPNAVTNYVAYILVPKFKTLSNQGPAVASESHGFIHPAIR